MTNIGNAHFLKDYTAHPIKHDSAIRATERMIIMGRLTNMVLNSVLLNAHIPIPIVNRSCSVSRVYTFRTKPALADDYSVPYSSLLVGRYYWF